MTARTKLTLSEIVSPTITSLMKLMSTYGVGGSVSHEVNKRIGSTIERLCDQLEGSLGYNQFVPPMSLDRLNQILPLGSRFVLKQDKPTEPLMRYIEFPGYRIRLNTELVDEQTTAREIELFQEYRKRFTEGKALQNHPVLMKCIGTTKVQALKMWLDGYCVHRVELSQPTGLKISLNGCTIEYLAESQFIANEKLEGLFDHGQCLPDYSCCRPEGLWPLDVRKAYIAADDEQRQSIQITELKRVINQLVDSEQEKECV